MNNSGASAPIWVSWAASGQEKHKVFAAQRHGVIDSLESLGGRHLVIVRYAPQHDPSEEWVFNRADIDDSDIVWAREMGEARNRELLEYYQGRKVWLLEPDKPAPVPVSYAPPKGSQANYR